MALPLFLTRENKLRFGIPFFIAGGAAYLLTNHFPIYTPQLLPMNWVDEAVPLVPLTVWIYLSEYPFFLAVYFSIRDYDNANKYLYSFLALTLFSAAIFELWPTTYPRHLFPLPEGLDPLTHFAFTTLRAADEPGNCCPSLHVSSVFLSVFLFIDDQRKKLPWFFLWGILIALSTLTTKQHYVIDVLTGIALAVVVYWIFHKWISYRRVDPVLLVQAKR